MRNGPSGMFEHRRHGALGAGRERCKKNTFDRKQQAEGGEEIRHRPDLLDATRCALLNLCYFAAPLACAAGVADDAAGAATGVPSGGILPDGSPK